MVAKKMSTDIGPLKTADERDRPQVAFLWLFWFVFSPVVLVWAPIMARKAKQLGFGTARYWVVFWATVIPYVLVAIAVIVLLITSNRSVSAPVDSRVNTAQTTDPFAWMTSSYPPLPVGEFPAVVRRNSDPQSRKLESIVSDGLGATGTVNCAKVPTSVYQRTDAWWCDVPIPVGGQSDKSEVAQYTIAWDGVGSVRGELADGGDWMNYRRDK